MIARQSGANATARPRVRALAAVAAILAVAAIAGAPDAAAQSTSAAADGAPPARSAAPAATADATRYTIATGGASRIVFTSKAPLESFEGVTERVGGWFVADLDDLAAGVELEVSVDLASFDTGNKKRNQHMRENHLETDRYPQAWFRGGRLLPPVPGRVPPGGQATVKLQGELDLHGVRREVVCDVAVTRESAGTVRVEAEFPVLLSDHAIERPKFLIMKLADEQKVSVQLTARQSP